MLSIAHARSLQALVANAEYFELIRLIDNN